MYILVFLRPPICVFLQIMFTFVFHTYKNKNILSLWSILQDITSHTQLLRHIILNESDSQMHDNTPPNLTSFIFYLFATCMFVYLTLWTKEDVMEYALLY